MPARHETPLRRVQNGRVRWVARYTAPDGRRRSAGTFDLKRDAQDAINAAYRTPPTRDLLSDYAADWTRRHPRSPRTNHTNDSRLRNVLDLEVEGRALGSWPLSALRRRHAVELVDGMLCGQGRSATGAANMLRTLSALMEDAVTDELAVGNPFRGMRVRRSDPRAAKPSREPRVLSWSQMHALAAAAGAREPMVRLLADCGLRLGELFALRREEQDLRAGMLRVTGSAWAGRVTGSTDTKRHDRHVPIPPGALALLREMPARIDSEWLFPTLRGRLWRADNWRRDVWLPARERSGVACSPQDLRHSFVTLLRAAGVDPADLAAMTGHSVATASGHYTHALGRSYEQVRRLVG